LRSMGPTAGGGNEPNWESLLASAKAHVTAPVVAVEHIESLSSASEPQKVRGDDGAVYAVKFLTNRYGNGRAIFTEQVVPLLGRLIDAPVPEVTRIDVTPDLLSVSSFSVNAAPATPGLHHGSRWADGFADRMAIDHVDSNREALGALSVLYTWLHCAGDQQLIYQNSPPHRVLSVDHSAFFLASGSWDADLLGTLLPPAAYDPFFDPAGLSDIDRSPALNLLERVTPEKIAAAVAAPPDEWGVSQSERVVLAEVVWLRQVQVLALSGRV